ncbi:MULTISPECIES: CHAT domain-containing protein [Streptomyces]|uniref:CHAT domain-containing protein n=1 Tax=Streptomyces TaxID=1883 RepID=UPI001431BFD1|nr:CHAT domain-containing protein [Streptomyces sp. 2BBP-J2]NIL53366.1 CHAT domain-containing protein [Streptomyces sp. 2BBP-J2]
MSRANGLNGFGRLLGRMLFVKDSNLVAADMGRHAVQGLQDWYSNPGDVQALQSAVSFYRTALKNTTPDHPQRAALEEQLGACQSFYWIATGFLGALHQSIDLMAASAARTPPADAKNWIGRRWMLMLLHILRFGVTRDLSDARLAEDCHRSLAPMLDASHGQPWAPDQRAVVYLTAAQLAALRGDETAGASWLGQARQTFGGSLVPTAGPGIETWSLLLLRRVRFLLERYESTHGHQFCQEAVALCSCGIGAFGERQGDPALFELRGRLLFTRYRLLGQRQDAQGARLDFEAALRLVDPGEAQWRADVQWRLATLLLLTSQHEQLAPADIALAHRLAIESLAAVTPGSADHAAHVRLLADVRYQFPSEAGIAYMRETAVLYERALAELSGTDHAWLIHNRLALLNGDFYRATGDPEQLSTGIGHAEQAVRLCPPREAPQQLPVAHTVLGDLLRLRYERSGDRRDYERAWEHTGQGVTLAQFPGTAPQWAQRLSNHALVLALPGRPEDYRAAERLLRDALDSESLLPQDKPVLHHNLGTILRQAAEITHDREQLRYSVGHLKVAVATTTTSDVLGRLARRNLAAALHSWWLLDEDPALLDEALEVVEAALEEAPTEVPDHPLLLSDLGGCLISRGVHHAEQNDVERGHRDVERAVEVLRQALRSLPPRYTTRPAIENQYGEALKVLGQFTGDRRGREEALAVHRQTVNSLDADNPSWALSALVLATTLVSVEAPSAEEVTEAANLCLRAARHPSATSTTRWNAAVKGAELLAGRGDWTGALDACTAAIAVLPQLAWGGLAFDDRLHALSDTSQMVSDAAAIALHADAPERALEILEHGRGQLLSHALDMRADLEAVRRQDPRLAAELELLRNDQDTARSGEPEHAGTYRRQRQHHWDHLVQQVRQLPGLADFLKPLPYRDLLSAAQDGPVIVLNSSPFRSDALVLHDNALTVVPLPGFRHSKAVLRAQALSRLVHPLEEGDDADEEQHIELRPYLTDLLDWLWTTVAEPVLRVLPSSPVKNGNTLPPRIWWCPTGVFNHLPVHAATRIKDPLDPDSMAGDSLTDRFVSSHTPTLRALKAAREADRAASGAKPPMLLVGVGRTPPGTDLAELDHVAVEIDALARLFPAAEPLRDEDALRETVLRRLRAGGWFHFAGHGEQNPEEPDGLLYLWDHATSNSLRIRDVTGLRLDKAELAFLSACQTHMAPRAHSDEPVSLAGALQLAGFRHVVAAQWQLNSLRARHVTTNFYEKLLESSGARERAALVPTARDAAHALYAAVRERRRERPEAVEVWAAYVHLGP